MNKCYTSFDEFLKDWDKKIRTAIRQWDFTEDDEDDIFQTLMLEFYEGNYLNIYDPLKASFSTFLYGFINTRMHAFNRNRRNFMRRTIDLEEIDNLVDDEDIELGETLGIVSQLLSQLPVRGTRDLHRLFDDLVTQITVDGMKNQSALAESYNVSPAAMTAQMNDLREMLIRLHLVDVDSDGRVSQWLV